MRITPDEVQSPQTERVSVNDVQRVSVSDVQAEPQTVRVSADDVQRISMDDVQQDQPGFWSGLLEKMWAPSTTAFSRGAERVIDTGGVGMLPNIGGMNTPAVWRMVGRGMDQMTSPGDAALTAATVGTYALPKLGLQTAAHVARAAEVGLGGALAARGAQNVTQGNPVAGGIELGAGLLTAVPGIRALRAGQRARLTPDQIAKIDDPIDRLVAARDAHEPHSITRPSAADEFQRRAVNERHGVDVLLREGGIKPGDLPAEANPSVLMNMATGGSLSRGEYLARRMGTTVEALKKAGLYEDFVRYLELNRLERIDDVMRDRAVGEATERAARDAVRKVGREPKAQPLFDDLKPETPSESQGSLFDMGRGDGPGNVGPRPATDALRTTATPPIDRFKNKAVGDPPTHRMNVAASTPRTDRIGAVEHVPMPDELSGARQRRLFNTDPPRQPTQPRLPGAPTPWEIEAINAIIDRTKLATVASRTGKARSGARLTDDAIRSMADEAGLPFETAKQIVRKAEEKKLPEWAMRSAMRDVKFVMGRAGETARAAGADAAVTKALPAPGGREITPDQVKALRDQWEATPAARRHEVEQVAQRSIFDLSKQKLDEALESGLITPEVHRDLAEKYELARSTGRAGYTPANRLFEEIDSGFARGAGEGIEVTSADKYLQKLNGSQRVPDHPIQTTLNKAVVVTQLAARNRAMKALVDLRSRNAYFAEHVVPIAADAKAPKGFAKITVMEAGKPTHYAVPELVAEAVKSVDGGTGRTIVGTMNQFFTSIFRAGTTTANFAFSLPNLGRDVSGRNFYIGKVSRTVAPSLHVVREWVGAFKSALLKDERFMRHLDSGAAFSGFQRNLNGLNRFVDLRLDRSKVTRFAGTTANPINWATEVNNAIEDATKMISREQLEREGVSPLEAAWTTRLKGGSPDYAIVGADVKKLNEYVPFLKAQILGVDRAVKGIRDNPKRAAQFFGVMTAKLALIHQMNMVFTDPDGTRSWDRVTDREKLQNWIVFVPGYTFTDERGTERQGYVKVPVGHEMNLLRAPFMAMMDPAMRNTEDLVNTVLGNLPMSPQVDSNNLARSASDSLISSVTPMVKAPIEILMNRDTFRGFPIVPDRLKGVDPAEQFTPTTSTAMRKLGEVTGVSPLKLQHLVRGMTGGLGESALTLADTPIEAQGAKPKAPITEIPGLKQIIEAPGVSAIARPVARRFLGGPASVDQLEHNKRERFYEVLNEANGVVDTFRKMLREGRQDEAKAYLAQGTSPEEVSRHEQLYSMAGVLGQMSKAAADARRAGNLQMEKQLFAQIDALMARLEGGGS